MVQDLCYSPAFAAQFGKYLFHKQIPLTLHIPEGRGDKDPDDEPVGFRVSLSS